LEGLKTEIYLMIESNSDKSYLEKLYEKLEKLENDF